MEGEYIAEIEEVVPDYTTTVDFCYKLKLATAYLQLRTRDGAAKTDEEKKMDRFVKGFFGGTKQENLDQVRAAGIIHEYLGSKKINVINVKA